MNVSPLIEKGIAEGLLPEAARHHRIPPQEAHPWPLILATALGAWLAILPLFGVLGLFFSDVLDKSFGPYFVGILLLGSVIALLRARARSLFMEQLAFPMLLVGLGSLAFGILRDLPAREGIVLLGTLALGLGALLPQAWLRLLLGGTAAFLLVWGFALLFSAGRDWFDSFFFGNRHRLWIALHGALGLWLIGLGIQSHWVRRGGNLRVPLILEPLGMGWVLAVLAGFAWLSGMTFLVPAALGPSVREFGQHAFGALGSQRIPLGFSLTSSLLSILATLWGARVWPGLRRPWVLGIALALAALAWVLPGLGGVWLVLILGTTTGRVWLAVAAALASAWIIGSFYYHLAWDLPQKALVLGGIGLFIAGLAWVGGRRRTRGERSYARGSGPTHRKAPWLIAVSLLGMLVIVDGGIWQKERLIAEGTPVFVPLAPVDPRSLMQGDYMRLRFAIPSSLVRDLPMLGEYRPRIVARRDERGVAHFARLWTEGERLETDEFLLALTPKRGRWTLVTDAWYFREGDAQRWRAARYGEFRVLPDGRALLVGLADEALRPIGKSPAGEGNP